MSGSGGFYKYRCKYFLVHNCDNWVYVNGAACAHCLVAGRDQEAAPAASMATFRLPNRDICVPQAYQGTLQYTIMEMVSNNVSEAYWTLRMKAAQPLIPTTMTTSDTPRPVMMTTGNPTQMGY